MPSEAEFTEFRPDGWPLCPRCGEDELASNVHLEWCGLGERPTVLQGIASGMQCYLCGWKSREWLEWSSEGTVEIDSLE